MDGADNLKNCPKFASFNYINSIIGSGVIGKFLQLNNIFITLLIMVIIMTTKKKKK